MDEKMSRDQKIEKINAYKKMLEAKKLPTLKVNEQEDPKDASTWTTEQQIHAEFTSWVESQLAILLGEEAQPTQSLTTDSLMDYFSEEQIEVLQKFADRMLNKATAPAAPAPSQPKQAQPMGSVRPAIEAKPIGNRKQELAKRQGSKFDPETAKMLSELDKLDKQGPQF